MWRALIGLLLLCAACASAPVSGQVTPTASLWSAPITLAQAEQADAPALTFSGDQLIAAWIGSDERGVHQDARRLNDASTITLPLPPTHPYDQRLFPGSGGALHLLWLDAGADDQTNLYEALLAPGLTVERGPVSVSEGLALDYSAVADDAGGLWTAWSGGLLAEMSVFVRQIDDAGRPLLATTTIAANATDPALVRTADGAVWLFWLSNGQLMRQRLDQPNDPQALTSAISLAPGDRLIDVRAGLDATSAYFFWNVTRATGANETWWTSGSLDARYWRAPQRLQIQIDDAAQIESGLSRGKVSAATSGDSALRWLEVWTGQSETLAAAVESDSGLGIILLRGGEIVGYTTAVPGSSLIGLPSLAAAASGNLALAWSSPGETTADLNLITMQK